MNNGTAFLMSARGAQPKADDLMNSEFNYLSFQNVI